MIKVYHLFEEYFYVDEHNKYMYITNDKGNFKISFDNMQLRVHAYRKVNVIHKPIYVKFFSDYRNKKLKQYKSFIVENVTDFKKEILEFKEVI